MNLSAMIYESLFCHLSSNRISEIIRNAQEFVCFAGPGIQPEPAKALVELSGRIGPEMITVSLDFDERVMRMGYGDIVAVQALREAGIVINNSTGLRSALIIVDREGYTYTPTPLYLEAESLCNAARNAMRLSSEQVAEALARLSPAAKAIAIAKTDDQLEKIRIASLPVEVGATLVDDHQFKQVDDNLKEAPPVRFDLARQVRVFEPYLQYVEMSLTGAAIQRRKLGIPASILTLGGSKDLEGRLRTTFDLIEKGGKLSSKPLENTLNEIRKNFTRSLGNENGRVILKSAKPSFVNRLNDFCERLEWHRADVEAGLQQHLNESKNTIVDYYLPRVIKTPPDALIGQLISGSPSETEARQWLNAELDRIFPSVDSLIEEMKLEVRFKDVTFETLNQADFLQSVKAAFPSVNWEKAYNEFRAAGEADSVMQ